MQQFAKSILASKVFWIATIQAVIGAIAIFQTAYPEVGGLMIAKSFLDVILRFYTSTPVTLK